MERKQYLDCIAELTQAVQTLQKANAALVGKQRDAEDKAHKLDEKIAGLEANLLKLREEVC